MISDFLEDEFMDPLATHSPHSPSGSKERERMRRVHWKVCKGEGRQRNQIAIIYRHNHDRSNCDTQARFKINNEENCQTMPLNKAKRVIFDRRSFLRRAGKVLDQLNIKFRWVKYTIVFA